LDRRISGAARLIRAAVEKWFPLVPANLLACPGQKTTKLDGNCIDFVARGMFCPPVIYVNDTSKLALGCGRSSAQYRYRKQLERDVGRQCFLWQPENL